MSNNLNLSLKLTADPSQLIEAVSASTQALEGLAQLAQQGRSAPDSPALRAFDNYAQSALFGVTASQITPEHTTNRQTLQTLRDYARQADQSAQLAKQATEDLLQGLEDAFVRFAQTGKLTFKDLFAQIVSDAARAFWRIRVMTPILQDLGLGGLDVGENAGDMPGGIFGAPRGTPPFTPGFRTSDLPGTPAVVPDGIFGAPRGTPPFTPGFSTSDLPGTPAVGMQPPVHMQGSQSPEHVQVHIHNAPPETTVRRSSTPGGGQEIHVLVGALKDAVAGDIAQGTGDISDALENAYGISRRTRR